MSDKDEDDKPDSLLGSMSELLKGMSGIPGMPDYEPSSTDRSWAAGIWGEYQALLQVGFTTEQAFDLVNDKQCAAIEAFIHYHCKPE
jgi:hypothetical protein